ncbi:MAG TPA: hypothetical protein VEL31_15890 [Ktedonobacteraceae bacterium]|nr:hypothetical protein [Ktedonobacteraceae bacterium]
MKNITAITDNTITIVDESGERVLTPDMAEFAIAADEILQRVFAAFSEQYEEEEDYQRKKGAKK